jgi:hypothetical protein
MEVDSRTMALLVISVGVTVAIVMEVQEMLIIGLPVSIAFVAVL